MVVMKKRNSKLYWLIFIGIVLVIAVIVFCVWLPARNKTKAPVSNNNSYLETLFNAPDEAREAVSDLTTSQYQAAILADPDNIQNYIDKSAAEYLAGDKATALETVNQGLAVDPTNELLRSRKDVLEKEYLNNSNSDATWE